MDNEYETLKVSLESEMKSAEIKIKQIDVEIAKLQGKRKELDDCRIMIWGLLN